MIEKHVIEFIGKNGFVKPEEAIEDSLIKFTIFDKPIIGYASVSDEMFLKLKEDENITYGQFIPPKEWLDF